MKTTMNGKENEERNEMPGKRNLDSPNTTKGYARKHK